MNKNKISLMFIPTADPHLSEYIAEHWKIRERISGFTGSNGTLLITQEKAGLWTDSRYFIQAEEQLKETDITLYKEGIANVPSYIEWISENITQNETIGIDTTLVSINFYNKLFQIAQQKKFNIFTKFRFEDIDFINLPKLNESNIFHLNDNFSGNQYKHKIDKILEIMKKNGIDTFLITALDEIAWTFNLRASDIDYNPVFYSFAIINQNGSTIFTNTKSKILFNDIKILPYNMVYETLTNIADNQKIWIDPSKTNYALYENIQNKKNIILKESPIPLMKAIKNDTEINGIKNAMVKDGIALCKSLFEIEKKIKNKNYITEIDVDKILKTHRAKQKDFFCESFNSIVGYAEHGAIVHYATSKDTNTTIKEDNLLLVDSGANYFDGTTDITRTFCFGKPTNEQKKDYTNVLKGHIALAKVIFPKGTHGSQLDVLAKQFLWNNLQNYGHGTGHGIGHFLCVHEGPQNIRTSDNGIELQPNMILSDEPGIYKKDRYGIRIENVIRVIEHYEESEFGKFLSFETLTLFPYELNLIETKLLNTEEINWLNNYHSNVYKKLSSFLDDDEKEWLKIKTSKI